MNTTVPQTTPEISAFVEEVRARLADLTEEQREELLDGLEADLAEQLADGATWSDLGDPRAYAAELRQAAGLPASGRRLPRPAIPRAPQVDRALDRSAAWFTRVVGARPWGAGVWEVVRAMRPVWWVARAWIAVTLLDVVVGGYEAVSVVPSLGHPVVGPVLLAAAVVVSVLVGLDRLWPGSGPHRSTTGRVALLGLNVVALLVPLSFGLGLPGYVNNLPPDSVDTYSVGFRDGQVAAHPRGLYLGRKHVTNLFVYGPAGQPIPAVQVFDQDGEPLALPSTTHTGRGADRTVPCPTLNGSTPLFNVYPLDQVALRRGGCTPATEGRTTPTPPLAEVLPLPRAPRPQVDGSGD